MKFQLKRSMQCHLSDWIHTDDKSSVFPASAVPAQSLSCLAHISFGRFFRISKWGEANTSRENHCSSPGPKTGLVQKHLRVTKIPNQFHVSRLLSWRKNALLKWMLLCFSLEKIRLKLYRQTKENLLDLCEDIRSNFSYVGFSDYSQFYHFQIYNY